MRMLKREIKRLQNNYVAKVWMVPKSHMELLHIYLIVTARLNTSNVV